MFRHVLIIFAIVFTSQLKAQVPCSVEQIGQLDACLLDLRNTFYADDGYAEIGLEFPYLSSQGPYDLQINGIIFENQYLYSPIDLCCSEIYPSDLGFDFEQPGTYQISLESISHVDNDCSPAVGSPLLSQTITILPQPTFDLKYTCLPNGDVKLDIVLTSNLEPYTDLFFNTFNFSSSNTLIDAAAIGDTIHSETQTLVTNETHIITISDCISFNDYVRHEYMHNCVSCTDTIAPTPICQDMTLNLLDQTIEITHFDIDNGSFDDCGVVSLGITETVFDCSDIGQNLVTLEVADGAGNISECTSIVTVNDIGNTCNSCNTLDRSPTIEFSHTEIVGGGFVKIWYRFIDFLSYSHLNPRLEKISSNNFVFLEDSGTIIRTPLGSPPSEGNCFSQLDEFMFLILDPVTNFRDCDRIETSLYFLDGFCDEPYISNSIILNCDNDNDGFDIEVDCNDNNPLQFPGAIEICDGVDNNCDGQIDEGFENIFGDCCPFELNINSTGIASGTYKADHRINTHGTVNTPNVELRAGSEVNLFNGFEVKKGSIFHGHIAPCN
jgi:hypothetical protein